MQQRAYDVITAKAILELAFPSEEFAPYDLRADGVYQSEPFLEASPPGMAFDWAPPYDMDWQGAPDPMSAPMLPIPFTAAELAAFMLDGVGGMIPETLGARIGYPVDEAALPDSPRWRVVREALQAAYALAEAAQSVVGEFDRAEQRVADELRKKYSEARSQAIERERVMERVIVGKKKDGSPEYGDFIQRDEYLHRLGLAKSSVAELEEQSTQAQDAVNNKWKAWRKAMVRQLLGTESRPSYIARRLEEMQSDEYKKCESAHKAAFERLEEARLKLKRRQAILQSPENLGGIPVDVAEADVEQAKRAVADAELAIRVMRGDFGDSPPMCKELGPTQLAMCDFSGMKKEPERQAEQFWFQNGFLDLEHWVALADVSAREAAMVLCLHTPRKKSFEDAKTTMRPDLPDGHLEHLDRRFADYAAQEPRSCRSLRDWYSAAQEMKIKLAPEAVSFMAYVAAQSNAPPAPGVVNGASDAPRKARRDLLTPVIEAAQKACGNVNDAPAVWAKLTQMAETGQRPLLGVSDDGIKWQDANDEPQFFKLRNLRDRLRRSSKKAL